MKHSKINIDRAPLTDEQIAAGQDFTKVLKAYYHVPKPWYKATWFVASAATVVTASLVLIGFMYFDSEHMLNEGMAGGTGTPSTPQIIEVPCEAANIPFMVNSIDADEGGVIEVNGSTITIPPKAFVFCDGGEVAGDVDINFRDFHDNVDLMLSGIPMGYDSAGTHYDFETAGMFELRGSQNGKPVCIRDGKAVGIDLKSHFGTGFNNYALDEETGVWDYLEPSPAVVEDCEPEVIEYNLEESVSQREELLIIQNNMQASFMGALAQMDMAADSAVEAVFAPCSTAPCVLRRGEGWSVSSSHMNDQLICGTFDHRFADEIEEMGWNMDIDIEPVSKTMLGYSIKIDGEELIRDEVLMNPEIIAGTFRDAFRDLEAYLEVKEEMKDEFAALEKIKPVMPRVAGDSGYQLELDFSAKEFPELAVYNNMLFEVDESRRAFDPSKANEPWNSMEVTKGSKSGAYVLVFKRGGETYKVDCYPVIEGADAAAAEKIFDRKLAEYQEKKAELEKEAEERKQAALKRQAEAREAAQELARQNQWANMAMSAGTASNVYRVFEVADFGIYNCDQPLKFRPKAEMIVTIVDDQGNATAIGCIYLADMEKDRLVKYYPNVPVKYAQDSPFMLWAIIDGKQLGIVEPDVFEAAKGNDKHEFTVSIFEEEIKSPEQVKAMLAPYIGG